MSARHGADRLTLRDGVWLFGLGLRLATPASWTSSRPALHQRGAGAAGFCLSTPPWRQAVSALLFGQRLTGRILSALALCCAGIALAVVHDLRRWPDRHKTSLSAVCWLLAAPCPTPSICWATGGSSIDWEPCG